MWRCERFNRAVDRVLARRGWLEFADDAKQFRQSSLRCGSERVVQSRGRFSRFHEDTLTHWCFGVKLEILPTR